MDGPHDETDNKRERVYRKRYIEISEGEFSDDEPPRKIVENGQDVDVYRRTKLHLAVRRKDATAVLVLCTTERNLVNLPDKFGQTALHVAARWGYADIIKRLLAANACTRVQDRYCRTPLHLAMIWERYPAAVVILSKDNTNSLQDWRRRTALHYASENGCEAIVTVLLAGATKSCLQTSGSWVVDHAASSSRTKNTVDLISGTVKGRDNGVVNLVDVQDKEGDTALHMAACKGHTTIVEMLLTANACPRIQNRLGRTPLQVALKRGSRDASEVLCDNDDTHNIRDREGMTALHYVAKFGFERIVRKLLFLDAHPHMMDANGKTPLELCRQNQGRDDIVKLIISSTTMNDIVIEWKDLDLRRDDIEYCLNLEAECITEIQQMKEAKIHRTTISYYDIARRHVSKVAVYLENDDIHSMLLQGSTADFFPNYAERISFRVKRAKAWKMLRDQCLECFAMLSRKLPSLPRMCIGEIFAFLQEREMRSFLAAF